MAQGACAAQVPPPSVVRTTTDGSELFAGLPTSHPTAPVAAAAPTNFHRAPLRRERRVEGPHRGSATVRLVHPQPRGVVGGAERDVARGASDRRGTGEDRAEIECAGAAAAEVERGGAGHRRRDRDPRRRRWCLLRGRRAGDARDDAREHAAAAREVMPEGRPGAHWLGIGTRARRHEARDTGHERRFPRWDHRSRPRPQALLAAPVRTLFAPVSSISAPMSDSDSNVPASRHQPETTS